tara:strand:+ start:1770 stop:2594 length:825 start_codon:yes stop_codon:yes gene_type:complete
MTSAGNIISGGDHTVLLELKARGDLGGSISVNRLGLKAETISITTSRTVPSFPIPMSGMATGESLTMAMDLGMANKTINISGIITEQFITKKFKDSEFKDVNLPTSPDNKMISVKMTAQEIAQLIHSYVDSSTFQHHQSLNNLIVLMPTRVGKDYQYYSALNTVAEAESTEIDDLPTIPFNYYVRDKGQKGSLDGQGVHVTFKASKFPDPFVEGTCSDTDYTSEYECVKNSGTWTPGVDITGMTGFIRNFNTTFVGGQPWVDFTLDFEIAQIGV